MIASALCAAPAHPGPCPTVTTQNLVLRPHRMSDADAIAQTLSDFAVARMLTRVSLPFDREDARDWLNIAIGRVANQWSLAITTGDDVHIGAVTIELHHGNWHLGYWLNRSFWGRGYMSEASAAVIDRFFRRMPEVQLHSGAFADNAASLRIQEKLGFSVVRCSQIYARSRNGMAPHIDTIMRASDQRMLQ